jgi:5-methylcytosine-specific restriction enzyme A
MMESPLCLSCKAKGIVRLAEELDHIVPVSKGGTNDDGNLQMLCKECHHTKTLDDLGYKPKPKIGLDGWPEEDEKFSEGGAVKKSNDPKPKTVSAPLL